ncbi:MAG TPA: response regulator transcription factor [Candidatus Baltobacteraceae bacterium]|nr:response regulator transcription factor [Candidatus Baltobacteraceae bacterium]
MGEIFFESAVWGPKLLQGRVCYRTCMEPGPARVAVIDDEPAIRSLLETELADAGFEVRSAGDGLAGLDLVRAWDPDLILLDVMMPRADGISLLPRYRAATQAPILILSAKGGTDDKVRGLDGGADQYVPKPFEMPELIARLRSALRRPRLEEPEQLTFRDLTIDFRTRTAVRAGKPISLTTREFDLLATFMREPRRVFSREHLISLVWGDDADVTTNAVETYISYLRGKIDVPFATPLLQTVRGAGYSLRVRAS